MNGVIPLENITMHIPEYVLDIANCLSDNYHIFHGPLTNRILQAGRSSTGCGVIEAMHWRDLYFSFSRKKGCHWEGMEGPLKATKHLLKSSFE